MKHFLLVVALICFGSPASAAYFKLSPLSKVQAGGFFKLGTPQDNMAVGGIVPVLVHDAADGFFLIPGITWDLVDIGYVRSTGNGRDAAAFGPSVHLDEPVKGALRFACQALPAWGDSPASYGLLKALLAPSAPGSTGTALALGPVLVVQPGAVLLNVKDWRGSVQLAATLSKRF